MSASRVQPEGAAMGAGLDVVDEEAGAGSFDDEEAGAGSFDDEEAGAGSLDDEAGEGAVIGFM